METSNYQTVETSSPILTAVNTSFITTVYAWMFVGLGLTAIITMFSISSSLVLFAVEFRWILFIVQLLLVIGLAAMIEKMNTVTAILGFLFYAVVMGLFISPFIFIFEATSVVWTFFLTAGLFAAMAVYGYVTKRDLTTVGNLALMGLVGVILASIVNWFIASTVLDWALTYIGIGIFLVLIAYDTQKIKDMSIALGAQGASMHKIAIVGALTLYLDFINLFLRLLRVFGKRR